MPQKNIVSQRNESDINAAEEQINLCTKRIDYFITEYSLELLANKMRDGDFEIPSYQRANTWEDSRKSRFIESLLMNLPIPFLFFWENPESGKLEIVDGAQRLRTIQEFIYENFVIGTLEKLPKVSGFSFKDLSESRQRKIKNRSIRGIILNEDADTQARLDLFDRINTGSKIANPTEIRRGVFQGKFMDLIIKLANDSEIIEMMPMAEKSTKERGREELLTRFFAYGDGLEGYKDRVKDFLNSYTAQMNVKFENKNELAEIYEKRVKTVFSFINKTFPFGFKRKQNSNRIARARFEGIAIGSYLALNEQPNLTPDRKNIINWIVHKEFIEIIGSDGANSKVRLNQRINFVKNKLLGLENGQFDRGI